MRKLLLKNLTAVPPPLFSSPPRHDKKNDYRRVFHRMSKGREARRLILHDCDPRIYYTDRNEASVPPSP